MVGGPVNAYDLVIGLEMDHWAPSSIRRSTSSRASLLSRSSILDHTRKMATCNRFGPFMLRNLWNFLPSSKDALKGARPGDPGRAFFVAGGSVDMVVNEGCYGGRVLLPRCRTGVSWWPDCRSRRRLPVPSLHRCSWLWVKPAKATNGPPGEMMISWACIPTHNSAAGPSPISGILPDFEPQV